MREADLARRNVGDADWNRAQQKDRRGTLRKYATVEQTIAERDSKKSKTKKKH